MATRSLPLASPASFPLLLRRGLRAITVVVVVAAAMAGCGSSTDGGDEADEADDGTAAASGTDARAEQDRLLAPLFPARFVVTRPYAFETGQATAAAGTSKGVTCVVTRTDDPKAARELHAETIHYVLRPTWIEGEPGSKNAGKLAFHAKLAEEIVDTSPRKLVDPKLDLDCWAKVAGEVPRKDDLLDAFASGAAGDGIAYDFQRRK